MDFSTEYESKSKYYNEEQFNALIDAKNDFTILHINARSLYKNFENIKNYLMNFSKPFNIIALTETWGDEDKGMLFELEGYKFLYLNRSGKTGGGVAIYIDRNLSWRNVNC